MSRLPLAPFRRMLKEYGAEYASIDSANELRKISEEFTCAVAERSVFCMQHAGRKTLQKRDILLAVR